MINELNTNTFLNNQLKWKLIVSDALKKMNNKESSLKKN